MLSFVSSLWVLIIFFKQSNIGIHMYLCIKKSTDPYLYKWKLLNIIISHFAVLFVLSKTRCQNQFCLLCCKALEAAAEVGALCWLLYVDLPAELRGCVSISLYLPLSACPFPTSRVPSTMSLFISRFMSQVQVQMLLGGSMSACGPESGLPLTDAQSSTTTVRRTIQTHKVLSLKGLL